MVIKSFVTVFDSFTKGYSVFGHEVCESGWQVDTSLFVQDWHFLLNKNLVRFNRSKPALNRQTDSLSIWNVNFAQNVKSCICSIADKLSVLSDRRGKLSMTRWCMLTFDDIESNRISKKVMIVHVSIFRCWSALNTLHFSLIRLWISSQWWYKYTDTDESACLKNKRSFKALIFFVGYICWWRYDKKRRCWWLFGMLKVEGNIRKSQFCPQHKMSLEMRHQHVYPFSC